LNVAAQAAMTRIMKLTEYSTKISYTTSKSWRRRTRAAY